MTAPDWKITQGTQVMLVTGMHRSGTSMLARAINLMGVALGDMLVPPRPGDNETGFWEHEPLVELHEQLLEQYASQHLGLIDLPPDNLSLPVVQHAQQKIFGLLRRDFRHTSCWAVKDPRIARLVPLWRDTLQQLGCEPVWVIAVRHPAEVAASLVKRNGISRERALVLWLKYNLEAEYHTRGSRRAFVHYPDMLEDWKDTLRRVAKLTGFAWPKDYTEAEADISAFIRPELKHQQGGKAGLPLWAQRAYAALQDAARSPGGEVDTTTLDSLREDFAILNTPLQEDIAGLREINLKQAKDIGLLQDQIRLLHGSTSWQLTRPVRAVKGGLGWLASRPDVAPPQGAEKEG